MTKPTDPRIARLITLIRAAVRPPAGAGRIAARYGARFDRYRTEVPYVLPRLTRAKAEPDAQ